MIIRRTQKDIADCLGVTPDYVFKIKEGTRNLSRGKQLVLLKFYQSKQIEIQNTINEISSKLLPSGSRKPYDKQKG